MLNAIIIAANILAAQPADQRDIAFDARNDTQEYKDQLNREYPGLENFWTTDLPGIFFKNSVKSCIVTGQIDGDIVERVV